jgi:exosortase
MTSISQTTAQRPETRAGGRVVAWALTGLAAALFLWFHWHFFKFGVASAIADKNWSHSILVPFISAYFIFIRRQDLSWAPVEAVTPKARTLWWVLSLLTLTGGLAAYGLGVAVPAGVVGQVMRLGGTALMGIGAVLTLTAAMCSPPVVRAVWAPLLERVGLSTHPEPWLRVVGLGVMISALVAYVLAVYPIENHMARGYAMILAMFGLALFLAGPRAMAVLWVPIAYLVFSVKVSQRIWQQVAQQLQDIAAAGSTVTLKSFAAVMNFDIMAEGNQITLLIPEAQGLATYPINIAEACSGLRMLMAFVALGTALAFAWDRRWWQRLTIILSTVPIAIAVNIGRVTGLGLLYLVNPSLAQGETHIFVGMLMLIPAAMLLLGVGWLLDKIVIEEPLTEQHPPEGATDPTPPQPDKVGWPVGRSALMPALAGAAMGTVLMLLAGTAYVLLLGMYQPRIIGNLLSADLASVLLVTALGVLGLGTIIVPWLMPRRRAEMPRARVMALGVIVSALVVGAAGQQTVLGMTKAVLFKKELPLRKQLISLPTEVGRWQMVGENKKLRPAVEDALGTKQYLLRQYEDKTLDAGDPGHLATLQIAYYPGSIGTVPHVPERCYVAGGMRPVNTRTVQLALDETSWRSDGQARLATSQLLGRTPQYDNPVRIPSARVPATLFTFTPKGQDQSGDKENVLYFFAANGKFLPSPDSVRMEGWDLSDEYAYYCKIEVRWPGISDAEHAQHRTARLLSDMLPEIMACLPDWQAVKAGRYPSDSAGSNTK